MLIPYAEVRMRSRLTFPAVTLLALLVGCGGKSSTEPSSPVQSVTLSFGSGAATLETIGETRTLTATVRLANGSIASKAATWSSSNDAVASVAAGVVTAHSVGQATITAEVESVKGTLLVTVATVQSVSIAAGPTTFASIGDSRVLTADVRLTDGSPSAQTPVWTSSNPAVATVSGNLLTVVGNGTTTIKATVGTHEQSSLITVQQVATAIELLPGDTVIKGPFQLRGKVTDARGHEFAGAPKVWTTLSPGIDLVDQTGNLTPVSTGVARIRLASGALNVTVMARTVWNVQVLSDLFPLFEFTGTSGTRTSRTDVDQAGADLRATVMGQIWTYLTALLPSSGSDVTDMYFTTWHQIWIEFLPFCGGLDLVNQTAWTACTTPHAQHFFVSETVPGDYNLIARFLTQQFIKASNTASLQFPWFMEGYSAWMSGGQATGGQVVGGLSQAAKNDFKTGDTQHILEPLASMVVLPSADFYANIALRTPVAVRIAQNAMLMSYLSTNFPNLLPGLFALIRANPGAGMTNDAIFQYILTQTGKTTADLEAAYLAHARTF